MAEVAKKPGVTAWTGAWRLLTDRVDHKKAVRRAAAAGPARAGRVAFLCA